MHGQRRQRRGDQHGDGRQFPVHRDRHGRGRRHDDRHARLLGQGQGGQPRGETPATLNLTLGTPGAFSPFVPGVARDYTTTLSAAILSTAESATLSVADASATATGHLVNGAFSLAQPLQAAGTSAYTETTPGVMGPVGGSASPLTLLTYRAPTPGTDTATLNFKQAITATEPLRTGAYAKTLTFTLSTTRRRAARHRLTTKGRHVAALRR